LRNALLNAKKLLQLSELAASSATPARASRKSSRAYTANGAYPGAAFSSQGMRKLVQRVEAPLLAALTTAAAAAVMLAVVSTAAQAAIALVWARTCR
jgi:hypothetical protein